jgi:hypothetical protein
MKGEIMDKEKLAEIISTTVYKGVPVVLGLAFGATIAPIDGGVTVVGASKFALASLIGYGAVKSAIAPDQLSTIEKVAQETAEKIRMSLCPEKVVAEVI